MLDTFFIIIISLFLYLVTGVLYLLYLPFKQWLKRTNKLTELWSKRINWIFLSLPIFALLYLYIHKDDRYPSKNRVEDIADIHLPETFIVLKDEYQDMWQDYAIFYDIQLNNEQTKKLISSIKHSKYYLTDNKAINKDTIWTVENTIYTFRIPSGRTSYFIKFDSKNGILNYEEIYD